jgi:hypothetical protein
MSGLVECLKCVWSCERAVSLSVGRWEIRGLYKFPQLLALDFRPAVLSFDVRVPAARIIMVLLPSERL